MEIENFFKENKYLTVSDLFNLLLVYRGARPAFLTSYLYKEDLVTRNNKSEEKIDYIKKNFPFFKITKLNKQENRKYINVLIHLKTLPKKQEQESEVHYLGRVLGYSKPLNNLKEQKLKKYVWNLTYQLILGDKKYNIFGERLIYKKDLKSKKKIFDKVAKEIGGSVEEIITKKIIKEEIKKLDNSQMKIPLPILFNLLLVYHKKRLAFYMMEWEYEIKNVKKYFPDIFVYTKLDNYYLISLQELPPIPQETNLIRPGVTNIDIYLGEVLGYSCPGQMIVKPIYSGISYFINEELFQSETCWRYQDIKDKTEIYQEVAKLYNLKLTSEKVKNIRVNNLKSNKLIKNVKNIKLKEKLKELFMGKIESFKWNSDDDYFHFNDLVNYKNKTVTINKNYLK